MSGEVAGRNKLRGGRRRKTAVSAGEALQELAHRLGIDRTLAEYAVLTSWELIVGEQIARVAKAERVDNGTLFVAVAAAPWRAELALRRQEILEKVHRAVGRGVVKEIRFR